MDRTSRIGLFICLLLLLGIGPLLDKIYPTLPPKPKHAAVAPASPAASKPATPAVLPPFPGPTTPPASFTAAPTPVVPVEEKISVLENDAVKITLTSVGAAIKNIELKQYKADEGGNIILNQKARSNVLSLSGWPGADVVNFQVRDIPNGLEYTGNLPGGLKWERTYTFGQEQETHTGLGGYLRLAFHKIAHRLGQPEEKPLVYTLNINDTLTNTGASDVTLPAYSLSVGRAEPLLVHGHYQSVSNMYVGSGWYTQRFHLTTINDFNPSTFLWIVPTRSARDSFSSKEQEDAPLHWLGVENQFFTVLLTPAQDRLIQHGFFQCFNQRDSSGYVLNRTSDGYIIPSDEPDIEAAATFPELSVHAGQSVTLSYGLYAGPKDYNRLDSLGANQGELMNYDGILPFSFLIVPMLTVLKFWYLIFHNYGVAIILLTLMIKAITWPLVSISNRSGKRMQALAPKIKEVQAKYKDNPEKLQTETFALYGEYGVNPMAGCLPALVQMPVFFSLYFMLMNAVELRGQSFLWVRDLTQPDTVWSHTLPFALPFFGSHLALNPLPIMVTALTMVMMRMTPQIGDPQQAKIAQWMPLVFLFIFYNFAAALSLYYVINNCVSIIQIYRNLKKPLPELVRVPRKKKS